MPFQMSSLSFDFIVSNRTASVIFFKELKRSQFNLVKFKCVPLDIMNRFLRSYFILRVNNACLIGGITAHQVGRTLFCYQFQKTTAFSTCHVIKNSTKKRVIGRLAHPTNTFVTCPTDGHSTICIQRRAATGSGACPKLLVSARARHFVACDGGLTSFGT